MAGLAPQLGGYYPRAHPMNPGVLPVTDPPSAWSSGMGMPCVVGSFGTDHILTLTWASSLDEACATYHLSPFGTPYLELDTFFANGGTHIAMVNVGTTDAHHTDYSPPLPSLVHTLEGHAPLSFLLFSNTIPDDTMALLHAHLAPVIDQQQGLVLHAPPAHITHASGIDPWMTDHDLHVKHVAVYFPHLIHPRAMCTVSPVFAMAGLFQRFDHEIGPWRAPSGTTALLHGGVTPAVSVCNEDTVSLTQLGCNVIRQFKVGTVVWGESTGVGLGHERAYWRYISIRRTLSAIRQHITGVSSWIRTHVEQGHDDADRAERGRQAILSVLNGWFTQGALVGSTAEAAYMVTTDPTDSGWCWHYGVCVMTEGEFIMTAFRLPARPENPSHDMV